MGKGRKPRPGSKVPTVRSEPPEDVEEGAVAGGGVAPGSGNGNGNGNAAIRWDFRLERVTGVAAEVMPDEATSGSREVDRNILVSSRRGVLGYAPAGVAAQILDAAQGSRSLDLRGRVLSRDDGLQVELCLYPS